MTEEPCNHYTIPDYYILSDDTCAWCGETYEKYEEVPCETYKENK